jgi:symplekin
MVGEIGLNNTEFMPDIVPVLIDILDDDTPAVVRQAILCGIDLFSSTLEKIAIQVIQFFLILNSFRFSPS